MNNNYQFLRMLYIYSPNILFLLIWLYYFKYSVFFSILLTPITYLVINGFLIYKQQFNTVHGGLDKLIIFEYVENIAYYICKLMVNLLFQLPYVNYLYGILKVKILIYLFNLVMSYIPSQKTNPLTEELQNDYMEILQKNRRIRAASLVNSNQMD
jgi:hypothetical protein